MSRYSGSDYGYSKYRSGSRFRSGGSLSSTGSKRFGSSYRRSGLSGSGSYLSSNKRRRTSSARKLKTFLLCIAIVLIFPSLTGLTERSGWNSAVESSALYIEPKSIPVAHEIDESFTPQVAGRALSAKVLGSGFLDQSFESGGRLHVHDELGRKLTLTLDPEIQKASE